MGPGALPRKIGMCKVVSFEAILRLFLRLRKLLFIFFFVTVLEPGNMGKYVGLGLLQWHRSIYLTKSIVTSTFSTTSFIVPIYNGELFTNLADF